MRGKKQWKRFLSGMLTGVMLVTAGIPAAKVSAAEVSEIAGEIPVNPAVHYQTLKGWGSSLCWWGNVIGSWGDQDFNGNGRPDREEIAELAFSPEYLNLNIVRYNVGGGDKADSSIKRVEGRVPGWTVDMTGAEDGTGDFDADAFYAKETEDMNDSGQLWMLEQANAYRQEENDIINEVFSNSPPYYMTNSGSSTGGVKAASNLKKDCYDDFAQYMARAAKWVNNDLTKKFGTGVTFIEPMNEPDTDYWMNGSTKQEGCTFEPGEEMSDMLTAMQTALENEGLADKMQITSTDETDLEHAINSFQKLSPEAKNTMTTIGAHTYSGTDEERHTLRKLAASYDKDLWMSEVCKGGGKHNHDSMKETQTQSQSQGIMADLKYMQSSAWVAWLVADSEYECLKVDENWGLIHCVFESNGPVADYHTNLVNSDGMAKDDIPAEGYWAVTKQFYTMMQYSKYLKAGYTMIEIGDDNMCAALSPDGKKLVIVAQNFGADRTTTIDLSELGETKTAVCYQTSDETNCAQVSQEDVSGGILHAVLPEYSVSTYVVDVNADMNNYMTVVEADVQMPAETGAEVSELGKFRCTDTSVSFTFDGSRAVLYGTKSSDGAIADVVVDEEEKGSVDLTSETAKNKAVIFDTGVLAESESHTVTLTLAEGQEGKSIPVSQANVIHGTLELKGGTKIRKIIPYDSAMLVQFDEVNGVSEYTVKYGTSQDALDQSLVTSEAKAVIKGVENDTDYYIQITDDLGGVSNIAVGRAGIQNENMLYFVNVGTSSLYTTASDEVFGYCSSSLDQAYGEDPVTGKYWGYVGDTNDSAYSDQDRWTSVRYSKDMNPLEYRFDVPKGTYNVTVAMLDPWKNSGRKTDIVINGETKATELVPVTKIKRTYQTTMTEDGALSVTVKPSAANTAKQDAILSFIEIKAADDNEISELAPESIGTVSGVLPILPDTIRAVNAVGNEMEVPVVWDAMDISDFEKEIGSIVTVDGNVTGTDLTVSQQVVIVPCNTQYFIDCNSPVSAVYTGCYHAAGLKNETADKAYTEGSWGYLDTYGAYNGTELNGSGWYAGSGQSIRYQLPLQAGDYKVTFGFHNWWGTRAVALKAYDTDLVLEDWGAVTLNASSISTAEQELVLYDDTDVVLAVEKSTGDDPVLSWIRIENMLDQTALLTWVKQAQKIDISAVSEETAVSLANALKAAKEQLLQSSATQQSVDAAAAELKTATEQAEKELQKPSEGEGSGNQQGGTQPGGQQGDGQQVGSQTGGQQGGSQTGGQQSGTQPGGQQEPTPVAVTAVKITAKNTKIAAGKKTILQASVLPADAANKAVKWSTSNKRYATVSQKGVVTTKKAGAGKSVTITATAKDGSGIKKSVKIKIMKHAVKKITLKGGKSVRAGQKLKLKASVQTTGKKANKTLRWTSSNVKYAAVSSKGVVTAKKAGRGKKVKITAEATDGTGKKKSITVNIK